MILKKELLISGAWINQISFKVNLDYSISYSSNEGYRRDLGEFQSDEYPGIRLMSAFVLFVMRDKPEER